MLTLTQRTILLALTAFSTSTMGQAGPNDSYRIQLTIQGALIEGSQERAIRLVGRTPAEQETILSEPLPTLTRGATFQLRVSITTPAGKTSDYTGSPRLRYEHFDCLSIAGTGVVTVRAGRACNGPETPGLWIVLLSDLGEPIAYNEYLFAVQ